VRKYATREQLGLSREELQKYGLLEGRFGAKSLTKSEELNKHK